MRKPTTRSATFLHSGSNIPLETITYVRKESESEISSKCKACDNIGYILLNAMPCIRLTRLKFELTNQDSAGGKNSTVLH